MYLDCIASDVSVLVLNVLFYRLCNYCESNSEEFLINVFYSYSYSSHYTVVRTTDLHVNSPVTQHAIESVPIFLFTLSSWIDT